MSKIKIPAFNDKRLTLEERIRRDKSPNSANYSEPRGGYLVEEYSIPEQHKSEVRIAGNNGQAMMFRRDEDYGNQTQSAVIHLGVGYNSDNPVSSIKVGSDIQPVYAVRSEKRVASEISISQKTDPANVDGEPYFAEGNIGLNNNKASISFISDSHIHWAKEGGFKFITGGEDIKNSAGAPVRSVGRFNFIAGNDDTSLSPVAKAAPLNSAMKDLYGQLDKSNSLFDSFNTAQTEFNGQTTTHQHLDLTVMLVGALAYGDPFFINDGKGLPSPELISGGMKCLPQQYILKIDALMQKLQTALALIYNTDPVGPDNSASPSFYTT